MPISQKALVCPLSEAAPWPAHDTLTHTEDVEAEALSDRLADQLVGEAVEAHMATQGEAPGLWLCVLLREKQSEAVSPLGKWRQLGEDEPESEPPSEFSANLRTQHKYTRAPIPGQVPTERAQGASRPLNPSQKRPLNPWLCST